MYHRLALAGLAWLAGCVRTPPPPAPGTGTLWGYVRLVPRSGVTPGRREYGPYADRRLRDVTFVDYSRPGFAVVYLDGPPPPGGTARLTITHALLRPELAPRYAAVGAGLLAFVVLLVSLIQYRPTGGPGQYGVLFRRHRRILADQPCRFQVVPERGRNRRADSGGSPRELGGRLRPDDD